MLWEKLIFFSSCSGSLLDTDTLVVRMGPPSAYHSRLENGVSWGRVDAFFLNRRRHGHANCITSLCQRVMKMFIHLAKYAKDEDRKVSFNSSGCKGFCFRDEQEELTGHYDFKRSELQIHKAWCLVSEYQKESWDKSLRNYQSRRTRNQSRWKGHELKELQFLGHTTRFTELWFSEQTLGFTLKLFSLLNVWERQTLDCRFWLTC